MPAISVSTSMTSRSIIPGISCCHRELYRSERSECKMQSKKHVLLKGLTRLGLICTCADQRFPWKTGFPIRRSALLIMDTIDTQQWRHKNLRLQSRIFFAYLWTQWYEHHSYNRKSSTTEAVWNDYYSRFLQWDIPVSYYISQPTEDPTRA